MPKLKETYLQIKEKNASEMKRRTRERIQQLMQEQKERENDAVIERSKKGRLDLNGIRCMCGSLRGIGGDDNMDAGDRADVGNETENVVVTESKYNHGMTLCLLCLIICLLIVNLFYVQHLVAQDSTQT
jgi:hypothetical protein